MSSSQTETSRGFFRCPVPADQSDGTITIGRRKLPAVVHEASIDGFTVVVRPVFADQLQLGRPWKLFHDGATLEVHPQWFFQAPDGNVQIGLRRLRDLTPPPGVPARWSNWWPRVSNGGSSSPPLLFGGLVGIILMTLALPGIGTTLGTSQRITAWIVWAEHHLRDWIV